MKFLLRFLLKPLSFLPALLMMYLIFSLSAQDGTTSSNLSYKVSYTAVSFVDKTLDLELTDRQITRSIRKYTTMYENSRTLQNIFYLRYLYHFRCMYMAYAESG